MMVPVTPSPRVEEIRNLVKDNSSDQELIESSDVNCNYLPQQLPHSPDSLSTTITCSASGGESEEERQNDSIVSKTSDDHRDILESESFLSENTTYEDEHEDYNTVWQRLYHQALEREKDKKEIEQMKFVSESTDISFPKLSVSKITCNRLYEDAVQKNKERLKEKSREMEEQAGLEQKNLVSSIAICDRLYESAMKRKSRIDRDNEDKRIEHKPMPSSSAICNRLYKSAMDKNKTRLEEEQIKEKEELKLSMRKPVPTTSATCNRLYEWGVQKARTRAEQEQMKEMEGKVLLQRKPLPTSNARCNRLYEKGVLKNREKIEQEMSKAAEGKKLSERKILPSVNLRCNRLYEKGVVKNRLRLELFSIRDNSPKKSPDSTILPSSISKINQRCDHLYELSRERQKLGRELRMSILNKSRAPQRHTTVMSSRNLPSSKSSIRLYDLSRQKQLEGKRRYEGAHTLKKVANKEKVQDCQTCVPRHLQLHALALQKQAATRAKELAQQPKPVVSRSNRRCNELYGLSKSLQSLGKERRERIAENQSAHGPPFRFR